MCLANIYDSGIQFRVQHAKRADGQWFTRVQQQGSFGYSWTKWTPCAPRDEKAAISPYAGKARLPR